MGGVTGEVDEDIDAIRSDLCCQFSIAQLGDRVPMSEVSLQALVN